MFIKVAQTQVKLYKEGLQEYLIKGKSIVEFCQTPLYDDNYNLSSSQEKQLTELLEQVEAIVRKLQEIEELQKLSDIELWGYKKNFEKWQILELI